ncbi:uncharacterized protein LOC143299052 [Babylonia areolata]|uniref:uncharacterized protein LOC143299052 n=1 Tax=Babylonia areolata TaxID=304850 RepID=UPI003FD0C3A7
MAPQQNPDKHRLQEQEHVPKDTNLETKNDGHSMSIGQKLVLNASLWGNEASIDFEHLYQVPILQTLGLPMRLATLTGAVAGPTACLFLPLLGWLTDRGSNPHRCKTMAAILTCGLTFVGLLCIIMANILHFSYLLQTSVNINSTAHASLPSSFDWVGHMTTLGQRTGMSETANGPIPRATGSTDSPAILGVGVTDACVDNSEVPFKAGLALLGFILLDIGYDAFNACIRSFVLMCSPRSEHSSLLIIGLIISSCGGMSTASLGLVDFGSMFGLSYSEGARLTIQTTVQAVAIIIFMIVGLSTSLLTVHRMLRLQSTSVEDAVAIPKPQNSLAHEANTHRQEQLSRSVLDAFQNSFQSVGGSFQSDQSVAIIGVHQHSQSFAYNSLHHRSFDHHSYQKSTESTPLLEDERGVMEESELERSRLASSSVSYKRTHSFSSIPDQQEARDMTLKDAPEHRRSKQTLEDTPELVVSKGKSRCCERGLKTKILLIFLAAYFSSSVMTIFSVTSSDFVGKAIYRGDPAALPGSQSLISYQDGVRMSSVGFFLYNFAFFINSIVQSRILALIGCRADFVMVHLVMSALMAATSVTERLEVYFLMTVVAGFHRACVFSIPFAVINDLAQSKNSKDGKSNVGLAISGVMAALPLAYCTLFSWVGSLEELTGVVAVPFWVACVTAVLATCMFLAVGKV